MAHKKGGGSTKNLRDSQPKYLGIKLSDGQTAEPGSIIIRQRGTLYLAGKNTNMGKDHTIYSRTRGTVAFRTARRTRYDSRTVSKKIVDVN